MFYQTTLVLALYVAGCLSQTTSGPSPPAGQPAPGGAPPHRPVNRPSHIPRPSASQPQSPPATPLIIPAHNGPTPVVPGQVAPEGSNQAPPASPLVIPAPNGPSVAVPGAPSPSPGGPVNVPAVDGPSVAISGQQPVNPTSPNFPGGVHPVHPLPSIATPGSEPQVMPSPGSGQLPLGTMHFPGSPGSGQGNNPFMNHQAQPFMPFGASNFMPPFFGAGSPHMSPPAQDGPNHSQPDDEDEKNDVSGHSFPERFGSGGPKPGARPGSKITNGIIRRIMEGAPVDVKLVDSKKIKISQKGHAGRKPRRGNGKRKDQEENKSHEKEASGLEAHHSFAAKRSRVDI